MAEGLSGELSAERRSKQTRLLKQESRLNDMYRQSEKEIEDAFVFARGGVRDRWEAKIAEQNAIVENLRSKLDLMGATQRVQSMREQEQSAKDEVRGNYRALIAEADELINNLSREISKSIGTKELDIQETVDRYQDQMKSVDSESQGQLAVIQAKRDTNYERLNNNAESIEKIDQEIDEYATRKIDLVEDINNKVGTNQIYRLATWVANKDNAAEVDRSTVLSVAVVWFGSLSGLIAFMGIFLALGSYVTGDETLRDRDRSKRIDTNIRLELAKFLRAVRRLIVYRKRRVATEFVEVEKVVFKEVPVEVLRKELVHVPFYTNDQRLLNLDSVNTEKGEEPPVMEAEDGR